MDKKYWILSGLALVAGITFFSGPKIPEPVYNQHLPDLPNELDDLESYLQKKEIDFPVRVDNQARIVWHHQKPKVTEYSIVYLHGFAGSYRDGYPVNVKIADTIGANLFLSRWAGHGLKPGAALENFTPETAWESAKEALEIGKRVGEKVIIMSTSTGGTLALKLAQTFPDDVHALINLSPNVEDDMDGAFLLNSPWGYEIAALVSMGKDKKIDHEEPLAAQYWDTIYPAKALVNLQVLVSSTMKEAVFSKIKCPVLTLYYHENPIQEDSHVEVDDYPEMHRSFATPYAQKKLVALEEPGTHFIGSGIKSENTEVVVQEIISFLRKVLEVKI